MRERHRPGHPQRLVMLPHDREAIVSKLFLDQLDGSVRRAIVDDDDLEVLQRLGEHAAQRLRNEIGAVEHADVDAHGRLRHRPHLDDPLSAHPRADLRAAHNPSTLPTSMYVPAGNGMAATRSPWSIAA